MSVCDYSAEPEMRWVEGGGEMMMRTLLIVATIIGISTTAFAQTAKVGGKPLKQVKPPAPMGCKLVGTVRGTKLWAGDCAAAPELRGAAPAAEPAEPAPPPESSPPAAKQ